MSRISCDEVYVGIVGVCMMLGYVLEQLCRYEGELLGKVLLGDKGSLCDLFVDVVVYGRC